MSTAKEARCGQCSHTLICRLPQMVSLLREVGMLKRQSEPAPDLISQLFVGAGAKLTCEACGHTGLHVSDADASAIEQDDAEWGLVKCCQRCGARIPAERLEIFPDTTHCVECQGKPEPEEIDYCPRCGVPMTVKAARSGGHYEQTCPSCRYKAR